MLAAYVQASPSPDASVRGPACVSLDANSFRDTPMLQLIPDLPEHVLGVSAHGEVTGDDYESILVPAIEARAASHHRLRLLYVLGPDFTGYTGAAAWEDAKVGMRHFTSFDRIAVVTDVDWVARMVRAFGFVLPGDVRVFACAAAAEAQSWICEPPSPGKLEYELHEDRSLLILRPHGELEAGDFERVAAAVDPWIEKTGGLSGLVILAEEFPGWDNFAALGSHLRFVREHHAKIRRVAIVTNSRFLAAAPSFARWFVNADLRTFAPQDSEAAIGWATGEAGS